MSDSSVSVSSSQTTVTDDGTSDVTDQDFLISIHNSFFWDDSGERLIEESEVFTNKNETNQHNLSQNTCNLNRNENNSISKSKRTETVLAIDKSLQTSPFISKQVNFAQLVITISEPNSNLVEVSLQNLIELVKSLCLSKAKPSNNILHSFIKSHICKGLGVSVDCEKGFSPKNKTMKRRMVSSV